MLETKIKHSIRYFDNPTNRYHSTYQLIVNLTLLSSVSVILSIYVLLTENVDFVRYIFDTAIVLLYLFIWKTIFFHKGKHNG